LIHAAKEGKLQLVELLVSTKEKINLDVKNKGGESALSYAAKHSTEMVKVLLDAGATDTGNFGAALADSVEVATPEAPAAVASSGDGGEEKSGAQEQSLIQEVQRSDGDEESTNRKRKRPPPGAFRDVYVDEDEDEDDE
jgi:hypothetical protein